MSLYMLYGGTNWGTLAAPVVATSYDYASPISEDRSIASKYYETKLLALFTRSIADFTATDRTANSTSLTTNPAVLATELHNPDTDAIFYVTRHATSSSDTVESFRLYASTSAGVLTIPGQLDSSLNLVLDGHQSKIITVDVNIGNYHLLYSTAEILTYAIFHEIPTLVLWVPTGEGGEFVVSSTNYLKVLGQQKCSNLLYQMVDDVGYVVSFSDVQGMTVLELDVGFRIIVLDRPAAYNFWAPTLSTDPSAPDDETSTYLILLPLSI